MRKRKRERNSYMKKWYGKLMSLLLCMAMVLSLAACGASESTVAEKENAASEQTENAEQPAAEAAEVTELEIFSVGFNASNDSSQYPWIENYLSEELGVVLRGRPNDDSKTIIQSILASGELPDIIIMSPSNIKDAIEGGMILDLLEYKDQLPGVFENDFYDDAINRNLVNYDGKLYSLPGRVGEMNYSNVQPGVIRWDLYKQIGYPQPANMDEYLEMMKDMQDAAIANGETDVYAFTFYDNYNGSGYFLYNVYSIFGTMMGMQSYMGDINTDMSVWGNEDIANYDVDSMESMLDEDGMMYQALKYAFKANQMGLMDPEAVGQNMDTCLSKVAAGKILQTPEPWMTNEFNAQYQNEENWKGYAQLMLPWINEIWEPSYPFGEEGYFQLCISADTENLDAALKFVNWLYSEEGQFTFHNGLEGWSWEYAEDGSRKMTDAYIEAWTNGEKLKHPDGGDLGNFYNLTGDFYPVLSGHVDSETGEAFKLESNYARTILRDDNLSKDWQSIYGEYNNLIDKKLMTGEEHGTYYKEYSVAALMPLLDYTDEQAQIRATIDEIATNNMYKMVFAEDEAEFEALWDEIQQTAEEVGYDEIVQIQKDRFKAGIKTYLEYMK